MSDYDILINDECESATVISSLSVVYSSSGTVVGALPDFDTASCGTNADVNGVWYSYTPTRDAFVTASIVNSTQQIPRSC